MLPPFAQNNAQQVKNCANMTKLTQRAADMRTYVYKLDEIHKVLFVTWIGVHLSVPVQKPYKIMELMPLVAQLLQPVSKNEK